MEAILNRLAPEQLRTYCIDAVRHELDHAHCLLAQALDATKRLEEVQEATLSLHNTVLLEDATLAEKMRQLEGLHQSLATALQNIYETARARQWMSSFPDQKEQFGDENDQIGRNAHSNAADAVDLCSNSDSETEDEGMDVSMEVDTAEDVVDIPNVARTASRKRRHDEISCAVEDLEHIEKTTRKATRKSILLEHMSTLMRARKSELQRITVAAIGQAMALKKIRHIRERAKKLDDLLPKVAAMVNACKKSSRRDRTPAIVAAMQSVVGFCVDLIIKGQSKTKRRTMTRLLNQLRLLPMDEMDAIYRNITALESFIRASFVVPRSETPLIISQLDTALTELSRDNRGACTVPEFMGKMNLLREIQEAKFESWRPLRDARVAMLADMLLEKLEAFRVSNVQALRRQMLLQWRAACKTPPKRS